MFSMSYRFMARVGARKGAAKVPKDPKAFTPIKPVTQPNVSILNGPIAPPLRMETPVMPSLDLVSGKAPAKLAMVKKPVTKKPVAKTPTKTATGATKKSGVKTQKKLTTIKPVSKNKPKAKEGKKKTAVPTAAPKKSLKLKTIKSKPVQKKGKIVSKPKKSKAKN